jgi:hypothetical protein
MRSLEKFEDFAVAAGGRSYTAFVDRLLAQSGNV